MPPLITHIRILATASLLSAFCLGCFAQLPSQNYVLTRTFLNASGSRHIEEAQIYDTLDRLTEAVYGEGENLSDKQNRYNEKVLEYTANG